MKRKCPICEKTYEGSWIKVYNGKGGSDKVCSVECAKVFDKLSRDKFYENLDIYRELQKELESLDANSDDALKLKDEIEVLEHMYGFSKDELMDDKLNNKNEII